MIDTLKIVSMINKETYDKIYNKSILRTSYSNETGEIFYKIVNDSLEGSYSSSLSVRIGEGVKYGFVNMYYIEIEGSLHKIVYGQNSVCGFDNLSFVCIELINFVEKAYDIKLPTYKHWFLQRVDIAMCYDLKNNENVCKYINSLKFCQFPRRKIKHYANESLYCTRFNYYFENL